MDDRLAPGIRPVYSYTVAEKRTNMPGPWNYERWMKETTVGALVGDRKRSALLLAVDNALKNYDFAHTDANKLKALHNVRDAFDAWCASKTDPNSSIRDKGGNVADF